MGSNGPFFPRRDDLSVAFLYHIVPHVDVPVNWRVAWNGHFTLYSVPYTCNWE